MEYPKEVSLFASAARPQLFKASLDSLNDCSANWEMVFAGPNLPEESHPQLRFYQTGNIKPAQCYEIARRKCTGEVLVWTADDAEYPNDVIGKAYKYWKSQNNYKLILSIQTKESGYGNPHGTLFDMNIHRFFGGDTNSPLMAPLAMISSQFLSELGGIDSRYLCGQYENSCVMLAYQNGGKVEIFGGEDCYIDIDHLKKSIAIGESSNESDFRDRPFATGYEWDRQVLQGSWCTLNNEKLLAVLATGRREIMPSWIYDISATQLDEFHPYPMEIPLDHSIGEKGKWC